MNIQSECIRHFCVFRTMGENDDLVTRFGEIHRITQLSIHTCKHMVGSNEIRFANESHLLHNFLGQRINKWCYPQKTRHSRHILIGRAKRVLLASPTRKHLTRQQQNTY